jgi:hypothetical protein
MLRSVTQSASGQTLGLLDPLLLMTGFPSLSLTAQLGVSSNGS